VVAVKPTAAYDAKYENFVIGPMRRQGLPDRFRGRESPIQQRVEMSQRGEPDR